jgi:hypothetical protein
VNPDRVVFPTGARYDEYAPPVKSVGEGSMNKNMNTFILWMPRILTIFMALFLMVFSLDVFDGKNDLAKTLVAFLIHNIPSILMLVILVIVWNREWMGAIIFPVLGLVYSLTNLHSHWSVHVVITAPLVLMGLLFLLAWNKGTRQIQAH